MLAHNELLSVSSELTVVDHAVWILVLSQARVKYFRCLISAGTT